MFSSKGGQSSILLSFCRTSEKLFLLYSEYIIRYLHIKPVVVAAAAAECELKRKSGHRERNCIIDGQ